MDINTWRFEIPVYVDACPSPAVIADDRHGFLAARGLDAGLIQHQHRALRARCWCRGYFLRLRREGSLTLSRSISGCARTRSRWRRRRGGSGSIGALKLTDFRVSVGEFGLRR
jgi:hypothetical protein